MQGFGVWGVLSTSFRVWRRNLLPFTLIAFVIYAPDIALRSAITDPDYLLALAPLELLLHTILSASLTYGVVMELHGTRPSLRACILTGLAQLVPVIGVVVLSTLAIGAALLLLLVPGIILLLRWYVAVPVAIIERLGVTDSLQRSRELTHGYKWPLFVILVVTCLAPFGVSYLNQETFAGIGLTIATELFGVLLGSLMGVVTAVAYTALRQVKDGTRLPEIASAFARFKS